MNLFQQILSVSKEFREHFEKENQQEERLKAVEEMVSGGGGGGSTGGSAYQPYKKQTALFYVNYENYYNPCSIMKKIGDDILSVRNEVNTLSCISITEENYENGDILKSKLTFMYPKNKHVPAVTVLYKNINQTISQHLVNTDTPETYEYLASLNKNSMGSNKIVNIASIKDYDTSSSITQTDFYVLAEIELHKTN